MNICPVLRIKHVDMAKIARIERQLDFRPGPHSPPQRSKLFAIEFQPLQFDAVVEDNALGRHSQHNVKFAGTRQAASAAGAHFGVPPMSRRIVDPAMRRLQIYVDDPLVQHLPKRAQQNDGVPVGSYSSRSRILLNVVPGFPCIKSWFMVP